MRTCNWGRLVMIQKKAVTLRQSNVAIGKPLKMEVLIGPSCVNGCFNWKISYNSVVVVGKSIIIVLSGKDG